MKLTQLTQVRALGSALFLAATVSLLPTLPARAVLPIAQLSLPNGNPLDQVLKDLTNQIQSFTNLAKEQMNEILGPVQEDLSAAIEEAFGPMTVDVSKAEKQVLTSIQSGKGSPDGVNPVVKYDGIARSATVRAVSESHLSTQAQENSKKTIENTQKTVEQINECGETAKNSQSTQDVLKAITCQQSGLSSLMATAIPQLDALGRANAITAKALDDLNVQMTGEEKQQIRERRSEAAMRKGIYSQFSFIHSPEDTPSMQSP